MSFCVPQFAVIVINAAGFITLGPRVSKSLSSTTLFPHPLFISMFNICAFGKDQMMRRNSDKGEEKIWVAVHLKICTHSCCCWDVCIFQKPYEKYVSQLYFCIDFVFVLNCTELLPVGPGITVRSRLMTWTLQPRSVTGPLCYLCCINMNHFV